MWGQVVIGPPGSGKSTYCKGMKEFLGGVGREVVIVNMDPSNDFLIYEAGIDVRELICLKNVMEQYKLGPNGGLLFCMEYLEKNVDWLINKVKSFDKSSYYFIFDCAGQVELYTSHNCVKNILKSVEKVLNCKLCVVNLMDSVYCLDTPKYVSSLIVSLSMMVYLEFPHVNVLSKCDIIRKEKMPFRLSYYTDVKNLKFIVDNPEGSNNRKRLKFSQALAEVVEDYDYVSYVPLYIESKEDVLKVITIVDKANGYIFGLLEKNKLQSIVTKEK